MNKKLLCSKIYWRKDMAQPDRHIKVFYFKYNRLTPALIVYHTKEGHPFIWKGDRTIEIYANGFSWRLA